MHAHKIKMIFFVVQSFSKSLVEEDGLPDVAPVLVEALPKEEEGVKYNQKLICLK